MKRNLTPKQARFVAEYLVDLNATQAAVRAGYSQRTAESIGRQLLRKTTVSEALSAAQAKRAAKTEITAERVVEALARIAFADPRSVFAWGPDGVTLRDSAELTADEAAAISEVSESRTESGGCLKAKLHDKVKALDLLGKHLGLFVDRVEAKVQGGVVIKWSE